MDGCWVVPGNQTLAGWDDVPSRSVPAWVLSLALHAVVLVFLALAFHWTPRGASHQPDRSGGIVLVDVQAEATEYLSEGDFAEFESFAASQQLSSLPVEDERPPDLPGREARPFDLASLGNETLLIPGADQLAEPMQDRRRVGGKVTTEIFGVPGTGSRFVYVFDRSGSMGDLQGKPLRAAKQQLLQSLHSLHDTAQFQIIFYNHQPMMFNPDGGPARLFFATEENQWQAEQFVRGIRADGGTDHLAALKMAFSVSPDVVFLLTDAEGGLTSAELNDLTNRNRSAAVVNLIEFGVGPQRSGDRSLERLARESGGQYLYKNILTLDD